MLRSKRFEPIHEIVVSSADDLSRVMGEAGSRVVELERQLVQLTSYRDEYVTHASSTKAIDAVKLQNFRSFLERLGEALRQHEKKLATARAEYEYRRAEWSAKRIEAESLGRAVDRFRQEERHAADRREQREGDEAASRLINPPLA